MSSIRGAVVRAVDSFSPPASAATGVFITRVSDWAGDEVIVIKEGCSVRVKDWTVNRTTGEWKARAVHYVAVVDGPRGETVFRGQSPEEILRSVATGLAMGVFDG